MIKWNKITKKHFKTKGRIIVFKKKVALILTAVMLIGIFSSCYASSSGSSDKTIKIGVIQFNGEDITNIKPYEITKKKIARTFQNIRLFKEISVLDNVKISFNYQVKYNLFHSIFRLPRFFEEEKEIEKKALELLYIFKLDNKRYEKAENLPYGEQRKLEIARALAANPKLLLLDEPAAGMNPQETRELAELIKWIREKFKISILLIEHDMKLVMNLCERIVVLDYGKK